MRNITLAFANAEAAAKVKNALIHAGLQVALVCSSGSILLQQAIMNPSGGVVILPPRLPDMSVPELLSRLPDTFDLLVLQSAGMKVDYGPLPGLTVLTMPLSGTQLTEVVNSLLRTRLPPAGQSNLRTGGRAAVPGLAPANRRSAEDEALLREAKKLLMRERGLTEDQAHRFLQKHSMDNSIRLTEVASLVLGHGLE